MAQVTLSGIKRELSTHGYLTELRKKRLCASSILCPWRRKYFSCCP